MRVRMLETARGAVDPAGTVVHQHLKGRFYDLPDSLALVYIDARLAEPAETPKVGPSEAKPKAPAETQDTKPQEQPKPQVTSQQERRK